MKLIWALALLVSACVLNGLGQDVDAGLQAYEKQDYTAALKQWQPLAEKGNTMAQFNLALLYFDGKGVTQDYEQAAQWFERAADQGYTRAQRNLGEMYAIGQGVKKDFVQSYKWLSICAANGSIPVCADHRDWVAKKLKGSQLAAAQRLARDWKPKSGS